MKKALLIVDVQNDFCPGGSYPVPEGNKIIEPLNKVINFALKNGWLIFASRDWHSEKLFSKDDCNSKHCIQNTYGARFHPKLNIDESVTIISKGANDLGEKHYSAFNGDEVSLNKLLKKAGVDEIYIGGLAFDYCVKNTALDAIEKGYKTYILLDATRAIKNSDKQIESLMKYFSEKNVKFTYTKDVVSIKL